MSCVNHQKFLFFSSFTIIIVMVLSVFFCIVPLNPGYCGEDLIFTITIDSSLHKKWGFQYPVTYVFDIFGDTSNIHVFRRDTSTEVWKEINKKTSNDFFNGIECIRFDHTNEKVYVSVGFNKTNAISIRFKNNPSAAFDHIAKYYDNRNAVYTLSNDNWGRKNVCGGIWRGMTDDASDNYQAAVHAARLYNLPLSIAINSKKGGDGPVGGSQTWENMQTELNNCTDDFQWEPAVHTRTHPCSEKAYKVYGYEWEILGCRNDILTNLTNIPYGQYVFEFILPCAYKDDKIRQISAGEFIILRDWDNDDHPYNTDYTTWNDRYNFYGIGGLQVKSYDTILQSEKPPGRYNKDHVQELNNAFDRVYNEGGIFYAMWHSDRYSNSVIHSTDPPESGTASTLMQHFAHIANRKRCLVHCQRVAVFISHDGRNSKNNKTIIVTSCLL